VSIASACGGRRLCAIERLVLILVEQADRLAQRLVGERHCDIGGRLQAAARRELQRVAALDQVAVEAVELRPFEETVAVLVEATEPLDLARGADAVECHAGFEHVDAVVAVGVAGREECRAARLVILAHDHGLGLGLGLGCWLRSHRLLRRSLCGQVGERYERSRKGKRGKAHRSVYRPTRTGYVIAAAEGVP
jgi:hypothetical protein